MINIKKVEITPWYLTCLLTYISSTCYTTKLYINIYHFNNGVISINYIDTGVYQTHTYTPLLFLIRQSFIVSMSYNNNDISVTTCKLEILNKYKIDL